MLPPFSFPLLHTAYLAHPLSAARRSLLGFDTPQQTDPHSYEDKDQLLDYLHKKQDDDIEGLSHSVSVIKHVSTPTL